ncbi:MAG: phosphoglycerate kinase [Deltaproteobacteria bacterium]|nr:phosphoglycerate kinase [Deltaproteobacteria bacterium]
MPSLTELEIESRRVLVRVDFDIEIKNGKIENTSKIENVLPTINYLIENEAKVILMSNLGNPGGKTDTSMSLEPVAEYLASLPQIGEIILTDSCVGDGAKNVIQTLRENQICLLENLDFHIGEENCDDKLAKQLASFCDIYVNEAFSISHKKLASTTTINNHARITCPGFQFTKELEALKKIVHKPASPFIVIWDGDDLNYDIEVIEKLLEYADTILLSGINGATFAASANVETGKTEINKKNLPLCRDLTDRIRLNKRKINFQTPVDFTISQDDESKTLLNSEIGKSSIITEAGTKTINNYKQIIRKAGTVLWLANSKKAATVPAAASSELAKAIAGSSAYCVALGAKAVNTIKIAALEKGFDHICGSSTAPMQILKGKSLPAVTAIGLSNSKPL